MAKNVHQQKVKGFSAGFSPFCKYWPVVGREFALKTPCRLYKNTSSSASIQKMADSRKKNHARKKLSGRLTVRQEIIMVEKAK